MAVENKNSHAIHEFMKLFAFIFLTIVIAVTALLIVRNILADLVWRDYSNADLALILNKNNPDLSMELGKHYFGGGTYDLDKALRAYNTAVDIDPSVLWGHYQLARIYFVIGDYNRALVEIGEELKANPENLRSLYVRGLIYGYRGIPGDLMKAEADFRRFIEWAPREWAGYNDLVWILSQREKYREMLQTVYVAFEKVPDAENNPWLWNMKGVAHLNLKEHQEAEQAFMRAQELANNLTLEEWQKAYPGNSPEDSTVGLTEFKRLLNENKRKASAGQSDN